MRRLIAQAATRPSGGFTLIELMAVVAILGILSAISVPKISALIDKSKDATTKGNLGALRSALAIYNADSEGKYPQFPPPFSQTAGYGSLLHDTLIPKYLSKIPIATPSRGHHKGSDEVYLVWNMSGNQDDEPTSGYGWTYDANPFDELKPEGFTGMWGTIRVLCKHEDSRGTNWSSY